MIVNSAIRSNAPSEPLVTVIMSVYNAGEYLRPSLSSIIEQTYRNLEIIIVDDGSTDGCFETVKDLLSDGRVRVFHQENASKPVALNRALDVMRGDFYAIQDADDISHPTRIEKQLQTLLDKPELAAVFCGNELILNGRAMAPVFASKSEDACKREIDAFRMPAHDPTGMFRMSLVGAMRYDRSLQVSETFDYILRIGEQYPMLVLGECLYGYRILPNSLTRRAPAWREGIVLEALRRASDRRGARLERALEHGTDGKRRSRNSIRDNNIAAHFIRSVLDLRAANERAAALRTGWECLRLHPFDPHYYKAFVYAVVSPDLVGRLKRPPRHSLG